MVMKRKKLLYWAGGTLVALTLAAQLFIGNKTEVETVPVQYGEIIQTVEDTGYVQSADSYDLQATQNARVVQVAVEIGEAIKPDQPLIILENLDLAVQIGEVQSQLAQSKSSASEILVGMDRTHLELEEAQKNLERVQKLYEAGVATQVETEKARLQVETSAQSLKEQTSQIETIRTQAAGFEKSLKQLKTKEQQLIIKSPIDGIVLRLPAEPEQVIYPGNLLVSIGKSDQLEIKAELLSDDMSAVKIGQKAYITAPVLGTQTLEGEIKKIYPQAEEKQSALGVIQRRVPVIITLKDMNNLKPGYEVKVAIETLQQGDLLVVSREAIRTIANNQKEVMVVVNGQIQHRAIETGIYDRKNIEITSGLETGDLVIRDGSLELKENTKVK